MEQMHPLAPHHLPGFIAGPGEADFLFTVVLVLLLATVLIVGNLYFQLHSLPERIAHKGNKVQFQVVAVLGLLALFTHNNLFWVAALLLALIPIPNMLAPLGRIAEAIERLERSQEPKTLPMAAPSREAAKEES